jgi:hypothetical protein
MLIIDHFKEMKLSFKYSLKVSILRGYIIANYVNNQYYERKSNKNT